MLAALILQVTDKCESDALKLMIFLIEGVLPDSYFADSLRGLSVDMAVFRELLRSKLPKLSKHLDTLQNAAKDGNQSYEPPLTNVFTMQWFLTLFCNCLPQPTVLRVWDLILLEGNEILLRTALAIWQVLAEKILNARSADEFYCIMGVLTRELLEFNLVDGNSLIKAVVAIGPLTELKTLRDHYLYNINPWGSSLPKAAVEKQLKIYPKQSMALDISTLKKQYVKLKQRQRQAHIIFSAAISRQPPPAAPVTMNHLLLGKSALVPTKRIGPPKGSIPPARQTPSTLDTELCDDESDDSSSEEKPARESPFEDNPPPPDGGNILMNNDNTSVESSAISEPEPVELGSILSGVDTGTDTVVNQNVLTETSEISDSFDTAPINVKVSSESDDENFDFEQFLADRVKCLKERSPIEEEPDQRINYARRNSERALQIIQENSLILHRILQCQTRLTPSPPLIHSTDATDENTVTPISYLDSSLYSKNVEMEQSETGVGPNQDGSQLNPEIDTRECFSSEPTDLKFEANVIVVDDLQSPQYGSRYTSILEKSKSLDERYNALILNIPPLKQSISEENDIKKTCDKTFDNDDNRSTDAKFNIFHKSEADYISLSDVSLSKDNHNDSGDVFGSKNIVHDLYKFDHIADNDLGTSYSESYFLGSSSKVDIFSDVSVKKSQQESSSGRSYLPTLSYFHSEKESEESIVTSPNANAFLKRDDFSRNEERERNTFFPNSNFVLTAAQSDSAISCLDSLTLSTNIPLSESPESTSEELNDFKCTDLALPSSSIGDGSDVPSKSDILRETSLSTDYDENYKSHETCLSRSGLDACYNYSESSPETEISKPTPWNNVCSKGLNEPAEEISPARIQSAILETPAEMNTLSVFSKGSDDVRYFEEPAKRCLTLQVGGSSNSKSPMKSPLKSPLRSPNKAFNPFPVPLSSRQSKEVPIKLGLYKK
ncbi:hypothetical protein NQ318_019062 [Aromia moschata]|uniref:Rab-GAP TBC domain-containing protein n=1 Tax=Aromia moschata TaxID=1265417 RepID=A0AAV8Y7R3_9CUCU|nr:hypothetical protein NQ318_019062 [Aromia moschata]